MRVTKRVESGRHHLPEDVIHRCYERALTNFFTLYEPVYDVCLFINNSGNGPAEVAKGGLNTQARIQSYDLWHKLKNNYGNNR